MKHFMLGILALSAGLQNVNAMEECGHDNNRPQIIKVLEIVPPFEEDIDKINVLKDQNKIEIELKMPQEFVMREVLNIDIPNNQNIKIETLDDKDQNQELYVLAVILRSMLQNENIDILTSYQPLIANMNNTGVGLREIKLYNTGLIGKLSFAYNFPLSNVKIYAHNAGLVIDDLAFENCGIIDSFSINGDIKYISDNAFANTIINNMTFDRQPNFDVYQSLANNRNIGNIDWKKEMSEEDDY